MTDVKITVNNVGYQDFLDVGIDLSIEQFARTFRATFSDKFFSTGTADFPFEEGAEVKITVDGEQLIDGFVDDIPIDYDDKSHSIVITGRSWTGHLADCSAIHKTGQWKNADLLTIATDICEPFGIEVKFDPLQPALLTGVPSTEKFRKFAIEDEESAYDCIKRAAKLRGVFPVSTGKRELLLSRAGSVVSGATLLRGPGGNILKGSRRGRFQQRYRDYIVKSQNSGADDFFGEDASSRSIAKISDEQVIAYRPLVVVSDSQGRSNELKLRAEWERNVRAGRSRRVRYGVQGAHKFPFGAGPIWAVNELVAVNDTFFDIDDRLLVVSATIEYGSDGTQTSLELSRPEAFDPEIPPKKNRPKGWSGW